MKNLLISNQLSNVLVNIKIIEGRVIHHNVWRVLFAKGHVNSDKGS